MVKKIIKPIHINATASDMKGNDGIGRYILIPGSNGRAHQIANHFDNLQIKEHPRGHHLYLGTISNKGKKIDVASIASGMGCPSMEIILHELFSLGAKRFLRVGTAGSLQSNIKFGDIINVQASVRDEDTTLCYTPVGIPAITSYEFMNAILHSADKLDLIKKIHTGTVHCKSSFYAREFGVGPKENENNDYMNLLSDCGILATEMETSTLCIQTQLYDHLLSKKGNGPQFRVLCGAILGIIVIPPHKLASKKLQTETTSTLINLAFETIRHLATKELS